MSGLLAMALQIVLLAAGASSLSAEPAAATAEDGSNVMQEDAGSMQVANAKQSGGGTYTCETRAGGGRRILYCMESTTYDECSSYCHNAYADCDSVHFETGAPSCFDILNGDADWGGQRF